MNSTFCVNMLEIVKVVSSLLNSRVSFHAVHFMSCPFLCLLVINLNLEIVRSGLVRFFSLIYVSLSYFL
ncbi:calmodulin-binding transcription activator 1 isoform X1 [Iris pallida]|uniref:Calmodulin-binding transcription activator 1 isoform X1 n=1 Tax=Iris pallida TaxID=29817 RepID=A0AAX6E600_IRIPA|nr:calmodulin-binding transcription activator 1 isoform X1 [Iris pallida]